MSIIFIALRTFFVCSILLAFSVKSLFPSLEDRGISNVGSECLRSVSTINNDGRKLKQKLEEREIQSENQAYYIQKEMIKRIETLGNISEHISEPGTTRPYLSIAGRNARKTILDMMIESGLDAWTDPIGNVIGDIKCKDNISKERSRKRKFLLIASHFDSVTRGGKWDGVYGIVAGIAVSEIMADRICNLPFDLRVVGFDDEEGASGFGTTNTGAKAFTGSFNISTDISDYTGFKNQFANVMMKEPYLENDIDVQLSKAVSESYKKHDQYIAALEIHIEQGPILEKLGYSIGAVSAIAGQTRMEVTWKGDRGHAGTVPMMGRRDALIPASMAVLFVQKIAEIDTDMDKRNGIKNKSNIVATVGTLKIAHAGSNVIPGLVSMSIDLRSPDDSLRENCVKRIKKEFKCIAKQTGTSVDLRIVHDVNAVPMTEWLVKILKEHSDLSEPMTSGAGHDSQFISRISDVGMLFVRCKNGVSHSPEEFVSEHDAYEGVRRLILSIESIAKYTLENSLY